ncbi:hypothetical protein K8I61_11895 [bacterium]|nr:hypothetical protein [bacterium]
MIHQVRQAFVIALLCAAVGFNLASACGDDDDDDDSGDDGDAACPIPGDDLGDEPISAVVNDCEEIGLAIIVEAFGANDDFTIRQIRGQYAITNEYTYYLRGAGLSPDTACYERLSGAGTFTVRTESDRCEESIVIDVVTAANPDARAFCRFSVDASADCGDDGGSGEGTDDDDDGDDVNEAYEMCVAFYVGCGVTVDDAELACDYIKDYADFWNDCLDDAMADYFACLHDAGCTGGAAANECANQFSEDVIDCDGLDDDGDDDDGDTYCSGAYAALYNDCGMAIADDTGQLSESEAVAACESGDPFADCVAGCVWVSEFCEDVEECVGEYC